MLKSGDVVADPYAPSVGSGDQIIMKRMNHQIVNCDCREIVHETIPFFSAVCGEEKPEFCAQEEKVFVNVQQYGNTSAATIPVALTEALEQGLIKPDSYLLMATFGAGLTWGAGIVKWGERITPLTECAAALPPCEKTALEILRPQINHYTSRAGN